jgi:hypothetical protein
MPIRFMLATTTPTPILTERLAALGWKGGKVTSSKEEDNEKPVKAADREL